MGQQGSPWVWPPLPPHNAIAICNAAVTLIREGNADPTAYVRGPDFPTGSVLIESPPAIQEAHSAAAAASACVPAGIATR